MQPPLLTTCVCGVAHDGSSDSDPTKGSEPRGTLEILRDSVRKHYRDGILWRQLEKPAQCPPCLFWKFRDRGGSWHPESDPIVVSRWAFEASNERHHRCGLTRTLQLLLFCIPAGQLRNARSYARFLVVVTKSILIFSTNFFLLKFRD